jgi:hypothetical protein
LLAKVGQALLSPANSGCWRTDARRDCRYHREVRPFSTVCLAILCCHTYGYAQFGPQPPCGVDSIPPHPSLADSPAVKFWSTAELGEHWRPPACTGWTGEGFSTLVTTAARFYHASGMDDLLLHSGAISSLAGMRYWSTTHKSWQTLIPDAYAVTGAEGNRRRQDFTLEELKAGSVLYFHQEDNLSGKAIYRLHIAEATPDRLVFDVANVTLMKYLFVPLFHPGEMQSVYYLDRESDSVWRYYSMARTGKNASSLTIGHEASWINRSVAFFRHVAGIPGDQEPPAAR